MNEQRVYNVVCILVTQLDQKIQVKSSKNESNKMGQNLSRKTAAVKRIVLPTLNMSKKSEQIHAYSG